MCLPATYVASISDCFVCFCIEDDRVELKYANPTPSRDSGWWLFYTRWGLNWLKLRGGQISLQLVPKPTLSRFSSRLCDELHWAGCPSLSSAVCHVLTQSPQPSWVSHFWGLTWVDFGLKQNLMSLFLRIKFKASKIECARNKKVKLQERPASAAATTKSWVYRKNSLSYIDIIRDASCTQIRQY